MIDAQAVYLADLHGCEIGTHLYGAVDVDHGLPRLEQLHGLRYRLQHTQNLRDLRIIQQML